MKFLWVVLAVSGVGAMLGLAVDLSRVPPATPKQLEARRVAAAKCPLPATCRNVVDLGNSWALFTVDVDGNPARFIYRRAKWQTAGGHDNPVMTENALLIQVKP